MAINFPNNPAVNDTFTVSGTTFTFTGVKWETSAVVELSSDTTPSLGGDLDGGAKNINNVGVITATGLDINGDADISGNLSVQGTTTTIDTAVTSVDSLAVDGNVTAGGSVGIGTINPTDSLNILKNATGAGSGGLKLQTAGSNESFLTFGVSSSLSKAIFTSSFNGSGTALPMVFAVGASSTDERLRIDPSGSLFAGGSPITESDMNWTHDPYQRPHIFTGQTGGNPSDGVVVLASPETEPSNTRIGALVYGCKTSSTTGVPNSGIKAAIECVTNTNVSDAWKTGGALVFKTRSDNGSPTERLRINSAGNIGIGTDNPLNGLDIVQSDSRTRVTAFGHIITRNHNNSTTDYWSIAPRNGGELDIGYGAADSNGTVVGDKLTITTAGDVTATGSISDSKGGLRDIPLNDESTNASYTLVASDTGKVVHVHSTTTTVVVPNSVFSVGNVVTILNGGGSNVTITQGSGLSLRNTADGSQGNRTLASFGMATIYFSGASVGYISGSNMT